MVRTIHAWSIAVITALILAGCESEPPQPRTNVVRWGPPLRDKLGETGIAILKSATKVEVLRVAPDMSDESPNGAIGGYPILAHGVDQDQAFATRLTAILLGDQVTENIKKCGLQPGVAYRLHNGEQSIEVLVCFGCDVLWPHIVGDTSRPPHREYQDFDNARAELLSLTKEAFPDDAEIQALSDKSSFDH